MYCTWANSRPTESANRTTFLVVLNEPLRLRPPVRVGEVFDGDEGGLDKDGDGGGVDKVVSTGVGTV